jgi:DNA adenine methylase
VERLIEPFAGSAAVSIAAAYHRRANSFLLNDRNQPLMELLHEIIHYPRRVSDAYEALWHAQHGKERQFYDEVRNTFNRTHEPAHLLFLLARCVKASVRYNTQGEFNQSPDNRRKGASPVTMRQNIMAVSRLLRNKALLKHENYVDVLRAAHHGDLVYMDPPYQGVCETRDRRYSSGINSAEFVETLHDLNKRAIPFILSYDGRTGNKQHGAILPELLALTRVEVAVGRSSQATLLGRSDVTYESIYISPALLDAMPVPPPQKINLAKDKPKIRSSGQRCLFSEIH